MNDNEFSLLRFKFEENSKENDLINIEIYVELYKEIEPGSYYLAKNRNKSILRFNPIDIEFNKTFIAGVLFQLIPTKLLLLGVLFQMNPTKFLGFTPTFFFGNRLRGCYNGGLNGNRVGLG